MRCPTHGDNKGKKIYGGQLTLSDPSHKKELAVWEDTVRRLCTVFLGHEDLDVETVMEDLCQALKGVELVVRVGLGVKKMGHLSASTCLTSLSKSTAKGSSTSTSQSCITLGRVCLVHCQHAADM